jgi:Lrp/AsnC family leucine-responsive transcriptional regulator
MQAIEQNTVEISALDSIDHRILSLLVRDGRMSFSDIGTDVSLSPHAVADRIRKLRRAGVIRGFSADVDYSALGRALDAFVDLRLLPSTDPDRFEEIVRQMPQVRELTFVTGRFDYQLRVACANADDLDQTLRAIRTGAGAAITETRIALRTYVLQPTIPA